ncbi:MAG: RsmB/NOP family class I SAM-dependent RNA methyltransferase [Betaproteobacteria bacterium]|nr:RsmB/NOP family class I SAM-dependent RNA methyltransferase [Betaproteobacteria bacterium]
MKARFTPALFAHAEAVLGLLLRFEYPADGVVSRYFREHRQLGHADRAFVAETVFSVLRRGRSIEARCAGRLSDRRRLLVALAVVRGWSLRDLAPVLRAGEEAWLAEASAVADDTLPPAVRCDLPDWLHGRLVDQYGDAATTALAAALNQPAPLDLRVNTLKADRAGVLAQLTDDGIAAGPGPLSPMAVRLRDKPALAGHRLFLDGSVEVQDAGSQLLGLLVDPKRGEMVVDFCAGAGGKTLLLGALMKNTGRLYAFDVSDRRLAKLKPRLARSGLSNVHPARIEHERDAKIKRLAGKVDRVLVDAPCSGLGTLRRNPDLKWRQDEASVAELAAKQAAILDSAANLIKPGGRLVYATCSLLAEENDAIVDAFLARRPAFRIVPATGILGRQGVALDGDRLRLLPHEHDTDGFFAVALERTA